MEVTYDLRTNTNTNDVPKGSMKAKKYFYAVEKAVAYDNQTTWTYYIV